MRPYSVEWAAAAIASLALACGEGSQGTPSDDQLGSEVRYHLATYDRRAVPAHMDDSDPSSACRSVITGGWLSLTDSTWRASDSIRYPCDASRPGEPLVEVGVLRHQGDTLVLELVSPDSRDPLLFDRGLRVGDTLFLGGSLSEGSPPRTYLRVRR